MVLQVVKQPQLCELVSDRSGLDKKNLLGDSSSSSSSSSSRAIATLGTRRKQEEEAKFQHNS